MLSRTLEPHLHRLFKGYPILTITGPRQSGKTTLAKKAFPQLAYQTLENPDTRRFATEDPRGYLTQFPDGAIFDEIQNAPHLASYLQGIVDEANRPGMFILTGSQNFTLTHTVSQSLAGRTAILSLLPLGINELASDQMPSSQSIDTHIFNGFYPRLRAQDSIQPTRFYSDYLQTYVQRDIRDLANIRNLALFDRFIRLCAGRIGQLLNLSSLANDAGITRVTAESWIGLLEASYLIYRLQPYHQNLGKRLTKSSKLYFVDVGFASYLLGITERSQIPSHPLRGNLYENLVISDLHKQRYHQAKIPGFYFYRDSNRNEIDCLVEKATHFDLIEIKSGQTFNSDYLKGIKSFVRAIKPPYSIDTSYVIFGGDEPQTRSDAKVITLNQASNLYR